MKKQKLGVAERKFRERQLKVNREIEYSSVQMLRDYEMVKSFVGGIFNMTKDKRR